MKLGLGIYRHGLDDAHFAFARQAGATHIVAHLVDYQHGLDQQPTATDQPVGGTGGWGYAGSSDGLWSVDALRDLRRRVEAHGLTLAAIENLDPAHWHDILLDGPRKDQQLEQVKQIVRNLGEAGIPALGYNFSLAGVASRTKGAFARGGATSVGMDGVDDTPVPHGMVWNMIYDANAPAGTMPATTHEALWQRVTEFLRQIVPVAEEAGVRLAAHPDDPPAPTVRQTPRLVYQPHLYQNLIDIVDSPANGLEYCLGTLSEMTEGDIYDATERYAAQGRIVYVHLRNVRGHVPQYQETFIDEGQLDPLRALRILHRQGFDGVIIPDHTPQMTCAAPWHAGMAHALGYLRALIDRVHDEAGDEST